MRHLTLEETARLVDEPPTPGEALHLAECRACREELREMRAQTEALAQLPGPEPAPRAWTALESRLAEEGLLRGSGRRPVPQSYAALRIAASLALVALGGAGGFAAWRGWSGNAAPTPAAVAVREESPPAPVREEPAAERPVGVESPAPEPPPVRLAGSAPTERGRTAERRSASASAAEDEAVRDLRDARAEYLRGLAGFAELAESSDGDPIARLAALEGLVRVSGEALQRAPDDPAINGYYLAAVGQRDAMLRQLALNTEATWY